ncbi:MAG: cation transporting ATPase C-terminal domain-containing protein, partial [Enterococcus sp.]
VAFLVLAYSSILHVFNVRSAKSIFRVDLATNKSLAQMAWLAIGITTVIALVPQTQELFYLVPISMNHWVISILLSIVPIIVNELIKFHKAPEIDPENI